MGKYDQYHAKLSKTAKVKKKLYRFRILIITFLSLFTISLSGFLIFKGKITQNVQLPGEEFIYGGDVSFGNASVLFGEPNYQYKTKDGEEWLDSKPTVPGSYSVRVCSKGAFGNNIYSEPVDFTIKSVPLSLELKNNNVIEYGKKLTESDFVNNLCPGDKIVELYYNYTDITQVETNLVVTGLKIESSSGDDRTSFYEFETLEETIKFEPKVIDVKSKVEDYTYNATELVNKTDIYDNLVNDDTISFESKYYKKDALGSYNEIDGNPVDAGSYKCEILKNSVVIKHEDLDVTKNYKFDCSPTFFNIAKKEIQIKTSSEEKIYDGQKLSLGDFKISNDTPLLENHEVKVVEETILDKNVGSIENDLTFEITDNNNLDVTKNYSIKKELGTLSIVKRNITVTPNEITSKTYDGKQVAFDSDKYIVDGEIMENDIISFNYHFYSLDNPNILLDYSPKDAGNYGIKFFEVNSEKSSSKILDNYNILFKSSEFNITPKEIKIKPQNISNDLVYDGESYTYNDLNTFKTQFVYTTENTLVEGEKLFFNVYLTDDQGNKVDAKNAIKYIVHLGDIDLENSTINPLNYIILKDETTEFSINKCDLNINPDLSMYEGDFYYGNKLQPQLDNDVEVNNEKISFNVTYTKNNEEVKTFPLEVGDYEVKIDPNSYLVNGNTPGVNNYNFIYDNDSIDIKKISIKPRPIKVKPSFDLNGGKATYTYGDFKFTNQFKDTLNYIISNKENDKDNYILDGQKLNVNVKYSNIATNDILTNLVHAGQYEINVDKYTIMDGTNDVSNNYEVTFEDQNIIINKRKINLRFDAFNNDEVYNGKEFKYEYGKNIFCDNLAEGDTLLFEMDSYLDGVNKISAINAGSYDFRIDKGSIKLSNEQDYEYDFSDIKTLNITKKPIKVSFDLQNKYQFGDIKFNNDIPLILDDNTFINNDELLANFIFTKDENNFDSSNKNYIDVGNYTISINSIRKSKNAKPELNINNFDFESDTKELVVGKRTIIVRPKLDNWDKVYDGEYYSYSADYRNYVLVDGYKIPDGHKLTIEIFFDDSTKAKNVGIYNLSLGGYSIEGSSNDNYDVKLDSNTYQYKILKKDVTIDLSYDITKELTYNGEIQNNINKNITLETNEILNIHVKYKSTKGFTEPRNADVYTCNFDDKNSKIVGDVNGLNNYNFICAPVKFTIKPIDITIGLNNLTPSNEEYNGDYTGYEEVKGNYNLIEGKLINDDNLEAIVKIYKQGISESFTSVKDAGKYNYKIVDYKASEGTLLTNYNVTIADEVKSFEIKKKPITIKPKSDTCDYIDHSTSYDYKESFDNLNNYEVVSTTGLVNGEKLSIKVDYFQNSQRVNPINSGVYNLVISGYDTSDSSVNYANINNYDITKESAKLTINKKALIVDLKVPDFDYGQKQINNKITISNSDIIGLDGSDAIGKLYLNVKYSNINSLTSYIDNPKNCGTYKVTFDTFDFENNKTISKSNYYVTIKNPDITFNINKMNIVLKPKKMNDSKGINTYVYDGKSKKIDNTQFDIIYNDNILTKLPYDDKFGVNINAINEYKETIIKNVGNYDLSIDDVIALNTTSKDNYVITCETNKSGVIINPKEINIEPQKINNKVFDGKPFEYKKSEGNYISKESFINGENIQINLIYKYNNQVVDEKNTSNAGKYSYEIDSNNILYNDNTLERNYNVIVKKITNNVTVEPKTVKVSLKDIEGFKYNDPDGTIYDGQLHEYLNGADNFIYVDIDNKVLNNVKAEIFIKFINDKDIFDSIINVGTYKLTIDDFKFKNTIETSEKESNYKFELDKEYNIKIKQKVITINLKDNIDKIYDNNDLFLSEYILNLKEAGLYYDVDKNTGNPIIDWNIQYQLNQNGKYIDIDNVKNVGKYKYKIKDTKTFITYNNEKLPLNNNYEVNCEYKNINITKKKVELKLKQNVFDYNGEVYDIRDLLLSDLFENVDLLDGNKVDLKKLEYTSYFEKNLEKEVTINESGTYKLNIKPESIKFVDESMDENYYITIKSDNSSDVIVNKKVYEITPTAKTPYTEKDVVLEKTYGETIKISDIEFKKGELPKGFNDNIKYIFNEKYEEVKDAGSYDISIKEIKILNSLNEDKTKNFDVILNSGKVIIKKMELDLVPSLKKDKFTFDNKSHKLELSNIKTAYNEKIDLDLELLRNINGNYEKQTNLEVKHGGEYMLKTVGITAPGVNLNNYDYDFSFTDYETIINVEKAIITLSAKKPFDSQKYDGKLYKIGEKDFTIISGNTYGFDFSIETEVLNKDTKENFIKNAGYYELNIKNIKCDNSEFINDIEWKSIPKQFNITKRVIYIKFKDEQSNKIKTEYTGLEFDFDSYFNLDNGKNIMIDPNFDDLLKGDHITLKFDSNPVLANNYQVSYADFEGDGNEVNNYDVHFEKKSINIEIQKRKLTITFKPWEKIYYSSNDEVTKFLNDYNNYEIEGLQQIDKDTHFIGFDFLDNFNYKKDGISIYKVKDVGKYKIEFNNRDISLNYDVELKNNEFQVLPMDVDVRVKKQVKTYDGIPLNKTIKYSDLIDEVSLNKVFEEDLSKIRITINYEGLYESVNIIDAGTYKFNVILYNPNYNFNFVDNNAGEIVINKKIFDFDDLKPISKDIYGRPFNDNWLKTYDGNPISINDVNRLKRFGIEGLDYNYDIIFNNQNGIKLDYNQIIDPGTYTARIVNFKFKNSMNENNYEFVNENVEFECHIGKRDLNIHPKDLHKIYDGKSFEYNVHGDDLLEISDTLLNGHRIIVTLSKEYYITANDIQGNKNYEYSILDYKIVDMYGNELDYEYSENSSKLNGIDRVYNLANKRYKYYDLYIGPGKITIDKRIFNYESHGVEKVYDGKAFNDTWYQEHNDQPGTGLAPGHRIECDPNKNSHTDVEFKLFNELSFRVYNEKNEDVTKNYEFNNVRREGSKINISTRELNIQLQVDLMNYKDGDILYLNKDFILTDTDLTNMGLLEGDTVQLKVNVEDIFDDGLEEEYSCDVTIKNSKGRNVTENYKCNVKELERGGL